MIKEQDKHINESNPFKFNVAKAIKESKPPKRNKDGIIMISKDDLEGKEWYYHG